MATTSEVKTALDEISAKIRAAHDAIDRAETRVQAAYDTLGAIPADYADELDEIDGYAGDDSFEVLADDEKTRLTAEFLALRTEMATLLAAF